MNIAYNYEIKRVDEEFKVMDVEYTSQGLSSVTVSTRLPFTNENLEDVVYSYAPFGFWEMESATYDLPTVGSSGFKPSDSIDVITEEVMDIDSAKSEKVKEIVDWRKAVLLEPIVIDGNLVSADHKALNTLRSLKQNIIDGIYSSVDFRCEDGTYITIDASNIDTYIVAVATHIEEVFSDEKQKMDALSILTTLDQVAEFSPYIISITIPSTTL